MDTLGKTARTTGLIYLGLIAGWAALTVGVAAGGYALAMAAGAAKGIGALVAVGSVFAVHAALVVGGEICDRRQQKKWAAERKAREEAAKLAGQGVPGAVPTPGKLGFVKRLRKQFSGGTDKPVNDEASSTAPPPPAIPKLKGNNRP